MIKEQKKRNHNHNYIDDFILLAKQNNSKVVLVANIISSEDEEIINMIKRFKSENIEILGVELGSELSNRAYKKYINSVEDYIQLAQKYSNIIKKKYPELDDVELESLRQHVVLDSAIKNGEIKSRMEGKKKY